jgi:hypothetical protein
MPRWTFQPIEQALQSRAGESFRIHVGSARLSYYLLLFLHESLERRNSHRSCQQCVKNGCVADTVTLTGEGIFDSCSQGSGSDDMVRVTSTTGGLVNPYSCRSGRHISLADESQDTLSRYIYPTS